MRKTIARVWILGLAFTACQAFGQWKVGINFRATANYVSDGADEVYTIGENGSTTRQSANGNSVTWAWSVSCASGYLICRDRYALGDQRLAGVIINDSSSPQTLTITLPYAGRYKVRWAVGDYSYGATSTLFLKDNGSTLLTVSGVTTAVAHFLDAGGTDRTAAAWVSSNTEATVTFATTTCQLVLGSAGSLTGTLDHFYLEYIPSNRRRVVFVQ